MLALTLLQYDFGRILADRTNVHPVGLAAFLVLSLVLFVVPRRWALAPLLVLACFIPAGQRVAVFGLDFTLLRLLVLVGWLRLLLRGETQRLRFHPIDALVLVWAFVATVTDVLLWGSLDPLERRLGADFDAIGTYFLFRLYFRDWRDLDRVIVTVTLLALPIALFFLVERSTGRNIFSVFGGVPSITLIREGKLRCQGAFSHPILAGCFWVSFLPLILARGWHEPRARPLAFFGGVAALAIVVFCNSSTPLANVAFVVAGASAWYYRHHLRFVRWSIAMGLLGLHLVMKAPVWHLISRIDLSGGSTGWHRYNLIDNAIRRWDEWWLIGTKSTEHWGYGLTDVTCQYVFEGIQGGALGLILFLAMLALAFRAIGRTWRRLPGSPSRRALTWALGVALLSHTMSFIAVSYFGQIIVAWFLILAAAASVEGLSTSPSGGDAAPLRMAIPPHPQEIEDISHAAGRRP